MPCPGELQSRRQRQPGHKYWKTRGESLQPRTRSGSRRAASGRRLVKWRNSGAGLQACPGLSSQSCIRPLIAAFLNEMPVSMEFLRGVLGLIGAGYAYMMGRSAAAVRKGWQKRSRLYGWTIRTAACMVALMIRHPLDAPGRGGGGAGAAFFAWGFWNASRPRKEKALVSPIFPDEP